MKITSDPDEKTSSKPTHGVRANRGDISEVSANGLLTGCSPIGESRLVGRQGQRRHGGGGDGGGGGDVGRGRNVANRRGRLFLSFFSRRPEP